MTERRGWVWGKGGRPGGVGPPVPPRTPHHRPPPSPRLARAASLPPTPMARASHTPDHRPRRAAHHAPPIGQDVGGAGKQDGEAHGKDLDAHKGILLIQEYRSARARLSRARVELAGWASARRSPGGPERRQGGLVCRGRSGPGPELCPDSRREDHKQKYSYFTRVQGPLNKGRVGCWESLNQAGTSGGKSGT